MQAIKASALLIIVNLLLLFPSQTQSAPSFQKGSSQKNIVETARSHQWSINFHKNTIDTINIVAIRIEFVKDTLSLTTGNGEFGMRNGGDKVESILYKMDTVYKYDALPHNTLYFAHQLEAVREYYRKASKGKLYLDYTIYPRNSNDSEEGYRVNNQMTFYSPTKKKKETYAEYNDKALKGFMLFIKDALETADKDQDSPFANLKMDDKKIIRDEKGRKTVFLIIHAGSSYLTDGTLQGYSDSESDMFDMFVTPDFFKYYRDTVGLKQNGVIVNGKNSSFLVDEVMMCPETSNQDSLNWGIQGVLANQIARQLGIPDLFTDKPGVGAFCIMDYAGYSSGFGFIPPYPSAWVRAFMGWDTPKTIPIGTSASMHVKALTSVLDKDIIPQNDTTILLVPINDHEYFLIENRQRNLKGDKNFFKYDTVEKKIGIAPSPFSFNMDSIIVKTSGKNESNVITKIKNNDISLPASGVLVWHIDENIIRERLTYKYLVNGDSTYRGVSLVEADGVNDLGIQFSNMMSSSVFDYGGADDVFPHLSEIGDSATVQVYGFGPHTRPSTRSNDGGHSWLTLGIEPGSSNPGQEKTSIQRGNYSHYITNFSDSIFTVTAKWDFLLSSWPKRTAPEQFFDPLICNLDKTNKGNEFVLVSKSGRLYIWAADTISENSYNKKPVPIDRIDLRGDTLQNVDTVYMFDSLSEIASMPSAIKNAVYVPSKNGNIFIISSLSGTQAIIDTLPIGFKPSTYVCGYADSSWAIGSDNGNVIFGKSKGVISSLKLSSDSAVTAIAAIKEQAGTIAVIQIDGTLSLCSAGNITGNSTVKTPGIGPFTLVTGDLDRDGKSEIVVCDSRHGLWTYDKQLKLASGWTKEPSDRPSYYSIQPENSTDRANFPKNFSPPALADINRDGRLDILVSGTNGLYAFNYKSALISNWPAYLDTRYWYQRGSVVSSPIVVTGLTRDPLVLFSSITGDNVTFTTTKVVRADKAKKTIWFNREDGTLDSIWDLSVKEIDTILTQYDSIVTPYAIPGGIIDAVNKDAKRPYNYTSGQSNWPLTTGSSLTTSPLIGYMDENKVPDLFAISTGGWVYRWETGNQIIPDSLFWPMTGYNSERSFAYGGGVLPEISLETEPVTFFSYPNPTVKGNKVAMKYKFSGPATNVRLDIYSQTGFVAYTKNTMGSAPTDLTGSYPDWNEHIVSLDKFGPGIYKCRLEATINGTKHSRYWKMAVVK